MNLPDFTQLILHATKFNHQIEIFSEIKSGKEATVYRALLDGELVAMKLYKPSEQRAGNTGEYLMGKYYRRPSQRRAVATKSKYTKKMVHEHWVRREFVMLEKLFALGAHLPKPLFQIDDAVFMELLGDEEVVAPRLCDVLLEGEEAKKAFQVILEDVKLFWGFGIVHGDLSPYNILWWKSIPFIIDFPQAVDVRSYPHPEVLLKRDLENIGSYFEKIIEIDWELVAELFDHEVRF